MVTLILISYNQILRQASLFIPLLLFPSLFSLSSLLLPSSFPPSSLSLPSFFPPPSLLPPSLILLQLLTDRFAQNQDSSYPCGDLSNYCGGTFQGIIRKLDYIQGLGVNAIWISPIPEQTDNGYHGYWQKDIYTINPSFGMSDDLKSLVNECHSRNIWVMLDV